jgi:hypothetical protein
MHADCVLIIRLWREVGASKPSDSLRGQVYHKNKRRNFVGLPQLFALIRETHKGLTSGSTHNRSENKAASRSHTVAGRQR